MVRSDLPLVLDAPSCQFTRGPHGDPAPSKASGQRPLGHLDNSTTALPPLTPSKAALPPLTPSNLIGSKAVKLKPSWDRSCTRRIANEWDKSCADDTFANWCERASGLRPSVFRSPTNRKSKLRGHWQAPESTDDFTPASERRRTCEEQSVRTRASSPNQSFRQHILTQVKLKFAAAVPGMPSRKQRAKSQAAVKGQSGSQEPDVIHVQVVPAKIPPRPKAPAYPGAREPHAHGGQDSGSFPNSTSAEQPRCRDFNRTMGWGTANNSEHAENKSDESDGIYEDDGSCDSDF